MIKLIQNAFGELNLLIDDTGEKTYLNYIKQIYIL